MNMQYRIPLALFFLAGCESPRIERVPLESSAAEFRVDAIPDRPVTGTIAGEAFTTQEVRYRVESIERRKRIDFYLSAEPLAHCGLPLDGTATRLWLRFPEITNIIPGEHRLSAAGDGDFSVHYERFGPHGWEAMDEGMAVFMIDRVELRDVLGRMRACFADRDRSCVEGSFVATECISELDVDNPVHGAAHMNERVEPLPAVRPPQ